MERSPRHLCWLSALCLLAVGCQVIGGFQDLTYQDTVAGGQGGASAAGQAGVAGEAGAGEGGAGGEAGAGGLAGASGAGCAPKEGLDGRPMVGVSRPDGTCFWIDKTEVPRGAYDAFVEAVGEPTQAFPCKTNTLATPPLKDCYPLIRKDFQETQEDLPAVCVDFCDARAYCEFHKKSLCKRGAPELEFEGSDWRIACQGLNTGNTYPYGKTGEPSLCNTLDNNGCVQNAGMCDMNVDPTCKQDGCGTIPAEAGVSCVATQTGALGMSGNVAEWTEDACDVNYTECKVRGGSFSEKSMDAECKDIESLPPDGAFNHVGFRCCEYPP